MALICDTPCLTIYIEEGTNSILIRQNVFYNWLKKPNNLADWTIAEKREFHNKCDTLIWNLWGNHYFVKVRGTSDFAVRNRTKQFKIKFDIKWVLQKPHWTVNATKIPKGSFERSSIIWVNRTINIDTEDTTLVHKGQGYYQRGWLHEYGHVIGNSPSAYKEIDYPRRGDEYLDDAVVNGGFKNDFASIMNKGEELRNRHLDYVLFHLNQMIPQTRFYL